MAMDGFPKAYLFMIIEDAGLAPSSVKCIILFVLKAITCYKVEYLICKVEYPGDAPSRYSCIY